MRHQSHPVIVVGAGLAGLTAARHLHDAGMRVSVFEAESTIGGRVRTRTHHEGFLIDRGFQILLDAYPALARNVDLDRLGARAFASGANIWTGTRLVPLGNPLRHPRLLLRDATSPVFGAADKLSLAKWAAEVYRARWTTAAEAANASEDVSALAELRSLGFSNAFIDRFARPFWGGIALDRSLSVSAGVLRFTTKMFLAGDAVLLRDGAGAIPRAIADHLPQESIHTSARVDALVVNDGAVTGARIAGEVVDASSVVIATDPPVAAQLTGFTTIPTTSVGCVTVYLTVDKAADIGTFLTLDGTGSQPVNHIAPLSQVQPSYAPDGPQLIAAVMLGDEAVSRDDDENGRLAQKSVSSMLGRGESRVVEVVNLPYCFYDQQPGVLRRLPDANTGVKGLVLASDATVDASINGAMMSGEDAAWAVRMAIGDTL